MKAYLPQMPLVLVLVVSGAFCISTHAAETIHYPLDTIAGGTTPDTSGNNNTGALFIGASGTGLTATPGIIGPGVVVFDGVDDFIASTVLTLNPQVFTVSLWFKTSSVAGGKLIGFGNVQNAISGGYDRHIYMTADGHLT